MKNNKNHLFILTLYSGILVFAFYVVSYFYLDKPIALLMQNLPGTDIYKFSSILSLAINYQVWMTFVALCLIAIPFFDHGLKKEIWSRNISLMALSIIVSSAIGGQIKYLLARARPPLFLTKGIYGFHFFSTQWDFASTPSAHTFWVFAFMCSLAAIFKKYSPVFILIAFLVSLSRIVLDVHYLSDVIFGAYIGIFTSLWLRWYLFEKGQAQ